MADKTFRVYVWGESHPSAGASVPQARLEEYDGDPAEAGDWNCHEGTAAELAIEAQALVAEAAQASAGRREYLARVAETVNAAAEWWS